jgi:hypothetical protein
MYGANDKMLSDLKACINNFTLQGCKNILKEGAGIMFNDLMENAQIEEKKTSRQQYRNTTLFGSILEDVKPEQDPNDFDGHHKIKNLENAFEDDPIGLKVAYMVATSHEYAKPNVEAALSFAKNYKWKESTMKVDKIEGISKPIIKEKVLEIANSLKKAGKNEWPLVVVDKLNGITPQTPGKKICVDGHHRKEALIFAEFTFTPVYLGTYTGDAEKSTEELINECDAISLTTGRLPRLKKNMAKLNVHFIRIPRLVNIFVAHIDVNLKNLIPRLIYPKGM